MLNFARTTSNNTVIFGYKDTLYGDSCCRGKGNGDSLCVLIPMVLLSKDKSMQGQFLGADTVVIERNHCMVQQVYEFLHAGARQWAFLVKGLQDVPGKLEDFNIPFYMMYGKPEDNIPKLVEDIGASLVVCDYVPLHEAQAWRTDVSSCCLTFCAIQLIDLKSTQHAI